MPACDTWPCSNAMEPLVSMNSASSCDSMVSTNSGFSDDSMEYLSAEERACLMFLEETIESLEAEDDSGVSNDEPDVSSCSLATKVDHLSPRSQTKAKDLSSHYDPNKSLGKDHKQNSLLTPLVLSNGHISSEPSRSPPNPITSDPTADQSDALVDMPPTFIPEPPVKDDFSNESKTEDCPPKNHLDPMLAQMPKTQLDSMLDQMPKTQLDSMLDQMPKTQLDSMLDQKPKIVPSDILIELIPPPSDFMDEPDPAPPEPAQQPKQSQLQLQALTPAQVQAKPQMQPQRQAPAEAQVKPQTQALTHDQGKLQMQSQTLASAQDQSKPQMQSQTQTHAKPKPQAPAQDQAKPQMQITTQVQAQPQLPIPRQAQLPTESIPIAPPPGFGGHVDNDQPQSTVSPSSRGPLSPTEIDVLRKKASLKRAPEKATAAPIVRPTGQNVSNQASFPVSCSDGHTDIAVEQNELKSPPAVAPKPKKLPSQIVLKSQKDSGPGHSLISSGDRMMNPQKVHIEALKKLGLLKASETDSTTSLNSSPPHRISPPITINTSTNKAPPSGDVHEMNPLEVEAQEKVNLTWPAQPNPENGGRESPMITSGHSRKLFEVKSASLERPRMSLKSATTYHSSLMDQDKNQEKANVELSPGQLRRSRPRPASAGSQKEMGIDQQPSNSGKEQDIRRSLGFSPSPSPVQPSTDSQVPPRSHGMISVVFTPHSKNGEERKQALRRLGLIRD